MENHEVIEMIDNALDTKLNRDVITISPVELTEGRYGLDVSHILGYNANWITGEFSPVRIVEYFENQLISDILDETLCHVEAIRYSRTHSALTKWVSDKHKEEIISEFRDVLNNLDLTWDQLSGDIFNVMGKAGYLSKSLGDAIIKGYFESIGSCYINIPLRKASYRTDSNQGVLSITFINDLTLKINTESFITNSVFFSELSRDVATENFLSDIRADIRSLLCKPKRT